MISGFDRQDPYNLKTSEEINRFKDCTNVHDLPDIFHYWSEKYLKPMLLEYEITSIDQFFAKYFLEAAIRCGEFPRFMSIGSGNCDTEVRIAKLLKNNGLNDFLFECLELNSHMLERGRLEVKESGLDSNFIFTENDFNSWVSDTKYTAIMANHSLHHVVELEHLFKSVKTSLLQNGYFVVSDMIGRNGHQRWPEALEIVQDIWRSLPSQYHHNNLLKRHEPEFINHDCSTEGFEGIRAQDILPLLIEEFSFVLFIGFSNVISPFIDRCFGHNFNPRDEFDRAFIDKVHEMDEEGFQTGKLKPTQMLAVLSQTMQKDVLCSRGLTPEFSIRKP